MLDMAMLQRLYDIYSTTNYRKSKSINRKEMKIIVDSIIEQLCYYFFQIKPNGIYNVRVKINRHINMFSEEDKKILLALDDILRKYQNAFGKTYSDHMIDHEKFIFNELKMLLIAILSHPVFFDNHDTKKLRSLLM